MADLIEMSKQRIPALTGMSTIEKAQLAVQIAAFVRASFSKQPTRTCGNCSRWLLASFPLLCMMAWFENGKYLFEARNALVLPVQTKTSISHLGREGRNGFARG